MQGNRKRAHVLQKKEIVLQLSDFLYNKEAAYLYKEVFMSKYTDYNFRETTKTFINLEGFKEPTPIQQAVIRWHAREETSLVFPIRVPEKHIPF